MARPDVRQAAAALFYAVTSISIIIFNKAVVSIFKFDGLGILVLSQMLFTATFCYGIKLLGFVDYPAFNVTTAQRLAPMAVLFAAKAGTDLAALRLTNIAMYSVLKRLVTPVMLCADYFLRNKVAPVSVRRAVYIIVAGTVMAGASDLSFDLLGYLWAMISCVVTAGHTVYIAKSAVEAQLNSFGLLFYCSILSIPFLLLFTIANGELEQFMNFPELHNPAFQIAFGSSIVLGFLIHYAIYICTTVNSPLTTSIMGQVKAIVQIGSGFILFDHAPITPFNVIGMAMSTLGSCYYAYLKIKDGSKAKPPSSLTSSNPLPLNGSASNDKGLVIVTNGSSHVMTNGVHNGDSDPSSKQTV
mmetsp:Transcript_36806/g.59516  ORF Transcript_36806/g.59516 Transcript_36806/m.59516 type:complete len:357 (-) Transcript_36806:98-1168(-)|eukprot:CAMPEP_0184665208 /NCGR_PEP_ID=MMETSP0308-20130426/56205_1 /TAXON_ID=38269 /ORGANISM="Gloeochaete witrockiana, Strain SAG 46.84" /LENGTH=356 /DNA_ID=CAMNT_0027109059 /DNA_START=196 /DNA_END=1266 /DNA_ORIENTATION=-